MMQSDANLGLVGLRRSAGDSSISSPLFIDFENGGGRTVLLAAR